MWMIASYKSKSPKGVISDLVVDLVAKSCLTLVTPWTVACQAPPSIFRQEYWSRLPFPPPEDLPHPGNGPRSLPLQADSLLTELQGKPQSDIHSVMLALCNPKDYTVHGIVQARILEWVASPFSREPYPTQGWNPGLLHCRQITYHLSDQGSPIWWVYWIKASTLVMFEYWKIN